MEKFIRWEFSAKDPTRLDSQEDFIVFVLAPLIKTDNFYKNGVNFYLTRLSEYLIPTYIFTKIITRLQVIGPTEQINKIEDIVNNSPAQNYLYNKEANDNIKLIAGYGPGYLETRFRKYLQDISLLGIDLHLGKIKDAKRIAVKARYETKPMGIINPSKMLEKHFHESSDYYRQFEKTPDELDNFWNNFCTFYENCTPWDHFYYNLILGAPEPLQAKIPYDQYIKVMKI